MRDYLPLLGLAGFVAFGTIIYHWTLYKERQERRELERKGKQAAAPH